MSKVVLVLDHHYTEAGLSFSGLKNSDRTHVYALTSAARLAEETVKKQTAALRIAKEALMQQKVDDEEEEALGFECYLAILKVTETGGAEGGGYRHRWGDDGDWEMDPDTAERECKLYNFF
jgi:hypothetical protein